MMILQALGDRQDFAPLWRALAPVHAFVLTRLVSFNCVDLRWTMVAIALRLFGAAWFFAERQFAQWAQRVLRQAWHGARFAAELDDADTMVAAGGR